MQWLFTPNYSWQLLALQGIYIYTKGAAHINNIFISVKFSLGSHMCLTDTANL